MKLRAKVSRATGATVHSRASIVDGTVAQRESLPVPVRIEIEEVKSGFFMYRYDAAGACIADTWHSSLIDAKDQARFEFDLEDSDWTED